MKQSRILLKTIIVPILWLCFCVLGCNQQHHKRTVEKSFYYWKSVFSVNDYEKTQLDTLQVKTIYFKLFDVDWDDKKMQPVPKAPVRIVDSSWLILRKINIIPVIFITNECIQQIPAGQVNALADKMMLLLKNTMANSFPRYRPDEVQIDCDWTSTTREKYFALLTAIKKYDIPTLSATIRLHQVKYVSLTGVPPVDKGLLMCYNMGNLQNNAVQNSILDVNELKKYTGKLASYPLSLDVGLPLFEWYVLFRNNQFKGLIKKMDVTNPYIKKLNDTRYVFLKDTSINDIHFKKDDLLRLETSEYSEIIKAAEFIGAKLNNPTPRLALFHLDSITLKKYSIHEVESIYNSLH